MIRHRVDQEDPSYAVAWADRSDDLIDFDGYTFEVKLKHVTTGAVPLTKTSGITAVSPPVEDEPNVIVTWSVAELVAVPPGEYEIHLKATTSNRDRVFRPGRPEIMELVAAP